MRWSILIIFTVSRLCANYKSMEEVPVAKSSKKY